MADSGGPLAHGRWAGGASPPLPSPILVELYMYRLHRRHVEGTTDFVIEYSLAYDFGCDK